MHSALESLGTGDLVFDVGAHRGDKTVWFLERHARVIAVEPQPLMAAALRERFNGKRVTVVEKGLSSEPGELVMKINSEAPTISTFAEHWTKGRFANYTWDHEITVPVSTMDLLISEFGVPRYAKIDVEGLEFDVFRGLTRKLDLVSFEFTKEFVTEAEKILTYAETIGFSKANLSLGEDDGYHMSDWADIRAFHSILNTVVDQGPDVWGDVYLS